MNEFIFISEINKLIPMSNIKYISLSKLEQEHTIEVQTYDHGWFYVKDNEALNILYTIKPSLFEGSAIIKFKKHAWCLHNFVGHPLMQLFALFGWYKLAFKIHENTIPKPIGFRNEKIS